MSFSDLINRKYDILQQQATAQSNQENAQAGLLTANTHEVGANAAAQRALQAAQGGLIGAQTQRTNIDSAFAPADISSQIGLRTAQGGEAGARAGLFSSQIPLAGAQLLGATTDDATNQTNRSRYGFKEGTTKVPGKGDGTVDKVEAKLAPGEAVLNKAAAEHLGRDTIALLNAIGSAKMGLNVNPQTAAPEPAKGEPGYAKGTSKVPSKSSSKAKSKEDPAASGQGISPEVMQALMQMGQGGGMPAPGSAQPMPMAMPQVAR